MNIVIVKDLPDSPSGAKRLLVRNDKFEYFVVSTVNTSIFGLNGPIPIMEINETLVFPSDPNGNITDWCEVAGGKDFSREEALADLAKL